MKFVFLACIFGKRQAKMKIYHFHKSHMRPSANCQHTRAPARKNIGVIDGEGGISDGEIW
ncbi:MAG: hypothetical protein IKJ65_00450 [Clostridia bacterium]|nr:hypothetical protein [Clostridia bacterium]